MPQSWEDEFLVQPEQSLTPSWEDEFTSSPGIVTTDIPSMDDYPDLPTMPAKRPAFIPEDFDAAYPPARSAIELLNREIPEPVTPITPESLEARSRFNFAKDSGLDPSGMVDWAKGSVSHTAGTAQAISAGMYKGAADAIDSLADWNETSVAGLGGKDVVSDKIRSAARWLSDQGSNAAVASEYNRLIADETTPESAIGEVISGGLRAIPDMALVIATTALTRNPSAGYAVMGAQVGSQTYGNSRYLEGNGVATALTDSFYATAAELGPERAFKVLEPLADATMPVLKKLWKTGTAEFGAEFTTELLTVMDEDIRKGIDPGSTEQTINRALKAGATGAVAGVGMGGGGAIITGAANVADERARTSALDNILGDYAQRDAAEKLSPSGNVSPDFDSGFEAADRLLEETRTEQANINQLDRQLTRMFPSEAPEQIGQFDVAPVEMGAAIPTPVTTEQVELPPIGRVEPPVKAVTPEIEPVPLPAAVKPIDAAPAVQPEPTYTYGQLDRMINRTKAEIADVDKRLASPEQEIAQAAKDRGLTAEAYRALMERNQQRRAQAVATYRRQQQTSPMEDTASIKFNALEPEPIDVDVEPELIEPAVGGDVGTVEAIESLAETVPVEAGKGDLFVGKQKPLLSTLPMDETSRAERAKQMGFNRDVFHATTYDIDAFDMSKSNPESDWGAGVYSTTSFMDASINYSDLEGADLTNKVERRAEEIVSESEYGEGFEYQGDILKDLPDTAARQIAEEELVGGKENVMYLKSRVDNPFKLGGENPSFLEAEQEQEAVADFMDEARNTTSLGREDFDTQEEYDDALKEEAQDLATEASFENEPEGQLVDFIGSLRYSGHDVDPLIDRLSDHLYDGGISAESLDKIMRETEWYAEDDTGGLINSEVYRQALEDAGFDGVIDATVYDKFGYGSGRVNAMEGIDPDTEHVIMFHPSQARDAEAAFDPARKTSADLLASKTTKAPSGLSVEKAQAVVNEVATGKRVSKIEVLESQSSLPDTETLQPLRTQSGSTTEGLYDPESDKIYLFANQLDSEERAKFVAFHELHHRGIRVAYGNALDSALTEARTNKVVDRIANAIYKDRDMGAEVESGEYTEERAQLIATDEALAELDAARQSENYAHIKDRYNVTVPADMKSAWRNTLKGYYEKIKRILSKLLKRDAGSITDAEIYNIIRKSAKAAGGDLVIKDVPSETKPLLSKKTPELDFNPDFSNYSLPTMKLSQAMKDDSLSMLDKALKGTENYRMNARQWAQDKMIPIRRIQEAVEKTGVTIEDFSNIYDREQLLSGRVEDQFKKMEAEDMAPLISWMHKHDISREILGRYLYARHAKARNERIATKNKNYPDGGSGMPTSKANRVLKEFDNQKITPALEKMAGYVDRITAKTRQNFRDYGLIDTKVMDEWESDSDFNKTYVPLQGFADAIQEEISGSGKGFDIRGDETKRALGRKSEPGDIMGHVISAYKLSVIRGEKNRVGQSLLQFAADNPNPNLWEIAPVKTKTVLDEKTGMTKEVTDLDLNNPNLFYTKVNGKPFRILLKDDRIAIAMKNLGSDNMGSFMRTLSTTTRYLSMTRTMLSPEFILTNFMRDIQTAGVNLTAEQGDQIRKATINRKAITTSIRAMFNVSRGKGKGDAEWRQYAKEYGEDGGKVAFFRAESVEEIARGFDRAQRMMGKDPLAKSYQGLKKTFELIEDMNLAVENATRLAAYKAARENGMSRPKAAILAKNLTVNFNRKGTAGPKINALFMFANASIQGAQRMLQASKNPKVQKVLLESALFGTMMVVFNEIFGGEDDDGESYYSKIPDFEKGRKFIFMIPDGLREWIIDLPFMNWVDKDKKRGAYLTIHLPYGYSVPYVMGEAIGSTAFGVEPTEAALRIASSINNSFNPVGSADLATTFAPTLADPFVELWRNTNYFGGPVHADQNPWDTTPDPKSGEGWRNTGAAYKYVAKKLNEWSGGSEVRPGWFDYHPETYRHFMEFAGGGTGSFFERVIDNVSAAVSPDREVDINKVPFLRSFFGTSRDFADTNRYYDNVKELGYLKEEEENFYNQVQDGEMREDRYEQWKEDRQEVFDAGLIGLSKSTEKQLRKMRKALKAARLDDDAEYAKELEDEILNMQREFNAEYNKVTLNKGWLKELIDGE